MTTSETIRLIDDAEFEAMFYGTEPAIRAFRNRNYTGRDYEATNVVACVAKESPSQDWEPCESSVLNGLTQLDIRYTASGVEFRRFGHL